MKFNCAHTFILEADSQEEFDAKRARYSELVKKASERLDIGYSHGLVTGCRASGGVHNLRAIADTEVEKLFDE